MRCEWRQSALECLAGIARAVEFARAVLAARNGTISDALDAVGQSMSRMKAAPDAGQIGG